MPEPGFQAKVWVNLPPMIGDSLQDLIRLFSVGDCRGIYLRTFCRIISMALVKPIEEWTEYKETQSLSPMPDDPMDSMSYADFERWISTFERIMRASGMIGNGRKADTESVLRMDYEYQEVVDG